MQYTLRRLREHFRKNMAVFPEDRGIRVLRTKTFRTTYVQPTHDEALELFDPTTYSPELFFRLHGLADTAHLSLSSPRKLRVYGTNYFLWRDIILKRNIGLEHTIARKNHGFVDEDTAFSDALITLTRTVERFNPWRGFRFSTYACNAIARQVSRLKKREYARALRFPTTLDREDIPERPEPFYHNDNTSFLAEKVTQIFDANSAELTKLEIQIINERVRIDGRPATLEEIGDSIGLSKERVRQLQGVALRKIRLALIEIVGEDYPLGCDANVFVKYGACGYKPERKRRKQASKQLV